jgi:cytoskeleton protein RodZ
MSMVTRKQEPQIPTLEPERIDPLGRIKPLGNQDPAGEAGWFLQREREARGLSLEDASVNTGIHAYHIEAIEYGDMTGMPSRMEALEMIAAYADFLGFEPEPLLEHYVSFLPMPEMAPKHHPADPAPLSSAKILTFGKFVKLPPITLKLPNISKNMPTIPGGNGGLVASVAAAFVLFSGLAWTFVPGEQPGSAPVAQQEQVAEAPALEELSDPMPTASTGGDASDVAVTEEPMTGPEPEIDPDLMGAFIQKNVPGVSEGAVVIEPEAALDEGVRAYGAKDGEARVVLKATRSIWLLIEDGKGNRVATQLLNQGDIYRVPNKPGLVATVQDGGAIKFMIDGVERGLLGEPGSVLAAESLDVKKLEKRG